MLNEDEGHVMRGEEVRRLEEEFTIDDLRMRSETRVKYRDG